ncbi:hypothetical protein BDF14DRAFT_1852966 [Spinellus fusiger]|nr:hypothetical protein BDF14DRAFT_1852966 [Spinellus fusiger]
MNVDNIDSPPVPCISSASLSFVTALCWCLLHSRCRLKIFPSISHQVLFFFHLLFLLFLCFPTSGSFDEIPFIVIFVLLVNIPLIL